MSDDKLSHADPADNVRQPENIYGQPPASQGATPPNPNVPDDTDGKSRAPENYSGSDPHGDVDPSNESTDPATPRYPDPAPDR